jgi:voltage-gated potassium channel
MLKDKRLAAWESKMEKPMLGLSLIFLVIIILPLAHPLTQTWRNNLDRIDILIWISFAIDYFGKLFIAFNKKLFFNTHIFELMIVIMPALRPLRLLRLIPLVGYFFKYARRTLSGRLLQYVSLLAVLLTTPSVVLMYEIEKNVPRGNIKSLGDSVWWAITTVTTVGYGDHYPITTIGRIIAVVVMMVGISLIGVLTASIASWFVKSDEEASDKIQMKQLLAELEQIRAKLDQKN